MRFLLMVLFPLLLAASASSTDEENKPLLFTGAKVLDPSGERWLDGRQVLIAGARIKSIAKEGEAPAGQETGLPDGTRRVDLKGLYLLPGLIDLHSHLLLHSYNETSWDDQVLKEPLELRTIRAVAAARATVEAGFTTLRDLGTEGAGFADAALRDAIAAGLVPGPRLFAATRAIVATGCYGPSGFDPRWDVPKGAQVADGVAGVRRAVREQAAAGADWIKFYADYRRVKGGSATPTFSEEEVNAIVDEARSAGLPVSAHAVTNEGIRRAVLAGVKTIEHGYGATSEVLSLMREHGVALCPTLSASEAIARYAGWKGGKPEPPQVLEAKEMFTRAMASGVIIACGSDAGVFRHGENAREIELMAAYGMPAAGALRAATSTAASVLGKGNDLGRLADGYIADIIAVRSDPLQDVSALRQPVLVMKEGQIVLDRR